MRFCFLPVILISAALAHGQAMPAKQDSGAHPYMGWSSWSLIRANPTEENIKAQADALLANHLDAAGYRYINVDDGWSDGFDEHGIPKPNLTKFPSGMDGMAKYMHAHGLKFGIYLNPGITDKLYKANPMIAGTTVHIADITDITQPGSTRRGAYRIAFTKSGAAAYIQSQVKQFDAWGVDFVKFDFVGPGGGNLPADNREELRQWHAAIMKASRPIWLELSNYMAYDLAGFWGTVANGWRIENDIECYGCDKSTDPATKGNLTQWSKVEPRFTDVIRWIPYAGTSKLPGGGWNDLDTLELGNGDKDGLTPAERQSMFTLWAISCAPLYLGSDLTKMDADDFKLITNKAIIAVDQAGVPARPLDIMHLRGKTQQAWMASYPDGSAVLALFNLGKEAASVKVALSEIDALRETKLAGSSVTDLVSGADVPPDGGGVTAQLESHGSRVFRLAKR